MKIPKRLIKLSREDGGTLVDRALKLNEESGEVAAAVLQYVGRKKTVKSKAEVRLHIAEEAVDTVIMCMDILTCLNFTDKKRIKSLVNAKLDKWGANEIRYR